MPCCQCILLMYMCCQSNQLFVHFGHNKPSLLLVLSQHSEVSIIGFLDPPTTEHFFVVALPLQIRVTSAWSMVLDRIYVI